NAQDTPAGLLQPLRPRAYQRHLAPEDDVDDEIQQSQRDFTGEPENPPGYARWVLQKCSHRFNRSYAVYRLRTDVGIPVKSTKVRNSIVPKFRSKAGAAQMRAPTFR